MVESAFGVLPAGHRFHGRYEVVCCLKAGGMGAVYQVVDEKTRRRRALKVMLPTSIQDADLRARFGLEATITAGVDSDHIVETFDADIDSATGSPFIVMELLRGEDLGAILAKRGRLPPEEVVQLLGQLALALDKTHAAGIIHRDLKPENLFLTRADDGSPRLKVLDFGIAKVMAQSAGGAKTTRVMGTPLYMSKEQITGDGSIGPAADLYSVAHIAFTLLTGDAYWNHEARTAPAQYVFLSTVLLGAKEPARARAARIGVSLPDAFDGWFARATAIEPELRFDRASSMTIALAEALGVAPTRSSLATAPPAAEAPDASRPALVLASSGTQLTTPSNGALTRDQAAAGVLPGRRVWPIGVAVLVLGAAAFGLAKVALPKAPASPAASDGPVTSGAVPAPSATSVWPASSAARAPTPIDEAPSLAPSVKPASSGRGATPAPRQTMTAIQSASPEPASTSKRPPAKPPVDDPTKMR